MTMALSTRSKKRQGVTIDINRTYKKLKSESHGINNVAENVVDRKLELTDPTPDIHNLFKSLDARCFTGLLSKNHVEVEWSRTLALEYAGSCRPATAIEPITITLNERLLKFRTRRDLVETLLHEMIHAFLFIDDTEDDHGPNFQKVMIRINGETGTNVSVFHNFDDEVALYENRLWRCNGKCRQRSPQFGLMRNETNNVAFDFESQRWWSCHKRKCGGKFELVYSGKQD